MTTSSVRHVLTVTALTLLLAVASASPAAAQGFVGGFVGYDFGGDSGCPEITGCEDKKVNWGFSVGALGGIVGFEAEFGYLPNFLGENPGTTSSVTTFMGNFMLAPKFGPVQPYGAIGIGLLKTKIEVIGADTTDENQIGWNIGGGLLVFPSSHVGIRGDIRYFHSFEILEVLDILGLESESKMDFGRASIGVVFKF
jgi:opacity protein-like surface antigen